MPKAPSSLQSQRHTYTITVILSLGKIMPSPCSYCLKEGLVYIAISAPSSRQPSSCLECTKLNMRLSCDVRVASNAKYTCPIILYSYYIPYLIYYRVMGLICCCKA